MEFPQNDTDSTLRSKIAFQVELLPVVDVMVVGQLLADTAPATRHSG